MATKTSQQSVYELTQREHEQIRERLKFLHRLLEEQQAPLEEIERLLTELRASLNDHFRNEEHDGFFEQIVAQAPQLSRQAESLTREHLALLGELDQIILSAKRDAGRPLCWRTLALRFTGFMKQLMHHESEENGMLQQAFVDDLGTKD